MPPVKTSSIVHEPCRKENEYMPGTSIYSLKNLADPKYRKWPQSLNAHAAEAVRPHIESFNFALGEGFKESCRRLLPVYIRQTSNGQTIKLRIIDIAIGKPHVKHGANACRTQAIYPRECRLSRQSYCAELSAVIEWSVDGIPSGTTTVSIGDIPIMVGSSACNVASLSPSKLAELGEEADECGGYFISNGVERVIRMLIAPRRNHPLLFVRASFKNRSPEYTEFGLQIRCVSKDQNATTNFLHFLNNGNVVMGFFLMREQFFVPAILLLKAFEDLPDSYIFDRLIKGAEDNAYFRSICVAMLRRAQDAKLYTRNDVLKYIGAHFRVRCNRVPLWYSDAQVGQFLLDQCILTHLDSGADKFNLLAYMIQRVCLLAKGECSPDNPDSMQNQEVLMSGHVYLTVLVERLDYWLWSLSQQLQRYMDIQAGAVEMSEKQTRRGILGGLGASGSGSQVQFSEQLLRSCSKNAFLVSRGLDYFIATGNLPHKSALVGLQSAGLTVTADSINRLRFLSHFAAVHRGQFFTEMRSSGVRQLKPEAWGFICSVHTPDGAPCGLLNHLTKSCRIQSDLGNHDAAVKSLLRLGVIEWQSTVSDLSQSFHFPVFVDGCLVGYLPESRAKSTVSGLRALKCYEMDGVSPGTEVCLVPRREEGLAAPSPGLFVFTTPARFLRPVRNLKLNHVEMIGTLEQTWLPIALLHHSDDSLMDANHCELTADCQLSLLGSFAPYSDFNQSPRNVYQCQMIKQAIGWGNQAPLSRADLKSYSLVAPQAPLCRTMAYTESDGDSHPTGCSAVVAVIAYTGYDMEDAMVMSKAARDRGLLRANIYISALVELREVDREHEGMVSYFFAKDHNDQNQAHLDDDGLPAIGVTLHPGDIVCSYRHVHSHTKFGAQRFKGSDAVIVERVALLPDSASTPCEWPVRATILLRQPRMPVIGDKCASRHGQKGICSAFWQEADMPFNEQGMSADIMFNPHGFPSRMTVGMMLESMAGKAAAAHGLGWIDATPFTYPAKSLKKRRTRGDIEVEEEEAHDAVDYLGRMLVSAGYEYYGTETMLSGVTGEELEAHIFNGIVYYQRLRHMVADKFQCRSTGPIDPCTGQPIKGRKRGGGIRLGEMERDALIASGGSFLLTDRLFNCSDRSRSVACRRCGSLIGVSPVAEKSDTSAAGGATGERFWTCRVCGKHDQISVISMPFASRFLINELAAMNIRVRLNIASDIKS